MDAGIEERWYQEEAVGHLISDINASKDTHPVAVIPTGGGKTVVLCKIIDEYLTRNPSKDVIILSHVDTILEQNYEKITGYLGDMFVGLYSASLQSKEKKKITVAGIQSVHRKPELFSNVGLVIVDECHMINSKNTGMYRRFLSNLTANYAGLTATPYRTGQGYIYKDYSHVKSKSINTLFNKLSYDLSSYENYNRLVEEGYLVNLVPAPTGYTMDTEGVRKKAGEFSESDLSLKFDREEVTRIICDRIIEYAGKKYKKWIIFAIDVEHCKHIEDELRSRGIASEAVYSGGPRTKGEAVRDFRNRKLTALINVNMLTTGMDVPDIDLVAHLRPTASPIFHVQSSGRGARPAPGKTHCLVLDFAGNTKRHGPINDVIIEEPSDGPKMKNKPPNYKTCDNCGTDNALKAKVCVACGENFSIQHKLNLDAYDGDVLSKGEKKKVFEEWAEVRDISYSIHQKKGSPSSLRVMYNCGFNVFSEWVMINHKGYPRAKAVKWVKNRWKSEDVYPDSLDELYANVEKLKAPKKILVNLEGKFPEIKNYVFDGDDEPEVLKNSDRFAVNEIQNGAKNPEYFDDDIPF